MARSVQADVNPRLREYGSPQLEFASHCAFELCKLRALHRRLLSSAFYIQAVSAGNVPAFCMKYPFLFFAAINGFLVVALGAFGAHALEGRINVVMLNVYHTSVQYQMFHTLAFLAIHLLAREKPSSFPAVMTARLFIAGIALFSGSLYLLAITSITWLGAITPIGGVLFLVGWFQLARACYGAKDA